MDRGARTPKSNVLQLRPGSSNGATADTIVLASKGTDFRGAAWLQAIGHGRAMATYWYEYVLLS